MANCLLGWPNRFTYGSLTASAAEAALPVTFLADDQGSADQGWQAPGTAAWARLALPTADTFRAFGLHRTNLTSSATVQWRVWSGTDTATTPAYDSGVVAAGVVLGYGQTVRVLPAPLTGQTVQCDVSDPTNPDGFLNIAQAYAGPAWQPFRNIDFASSNGRASQSARTVTRAGGVILRSDWLKRVYDLTLAGVRDAEVWPLLMDLDRYARRGNNILFIPDPLATTLNYESLFGELETQGNVTWPYKTPDARGWRAIITERL